MNKKILFISMISIIVISQSQTVIATDITVDVTVTDVTGGSGIGNAKVQKVFNGEYYDPISTNQYGQCSIVHTLEYPGGIPDHLILHAYRDPELTNCGFDIGFEHNVIRTESLEAEDTYSIPLGEEGTHVELHGIDTTMEIEEGDYVELSFTMKHWRPMPGYPVPVEWGDSGARLWFRAVPKGTCPEDWGDGSYIGYTDVFDDPGLYPGATEYLSATLSTGEYKPCTYEIRAWYTYTSSHSSYKLIGDGFLVTTLTVNEKEEVSSDNSDDAETDQDENNEDGMGESDDSGSDGEDEYVTITGSVFDDYKDIVGAEIMFDPWSNIESEISTFSDYNGEYSVDIKKNTKYNIYVDKDGYEVTTVNEFESGINTNRDLYLEKLDDGGYSSNPTPGFEGILLILSLFIFILHGNRNK